MHENENNTHEDKDPAREINVTWRRRRQELDTNMESYIRGVTSGLILLHVVLACFEIKLRCTGKKGTTNFIFPCAPFYIFNTYTRRYKIKRIIAFCRIKFGHEKANLAFFIRRKSSFASNSLSIIYLFGFSGKHENFLFSKEGKVCIKIGTRV